MDKTVVAVTGVGVVSPCGVGANEFWQGLLSEPPTGQRQVKDWDPSPYFDNAKQVRRSDRFSQFAIAAATEAMDQAGALTEGHDPNRIGVSLGSGIGGLETLETQIVTANTNGPAKVSPFLIPMMMSNAAGAQVSLRFGLLGPCETVVTACAAGTHSIGRAADWIRSGRCDAVLAGSSESSLTLTGIAGFKNMKALSPSGISRPFDQDRDGFVISEGSGVLVLERLDLAIARGATVLALLVGSGSTADAHHITAPSPGGQGAVRCMLQALEDSNLAASDIRQINAHGTSTALNDAAEATAVAEVFGEDDCPPLTSIKGVTGHSLGAAGALEAVSSVLSIAKKVIPPTAGTKNYDPQIAKLNLVTQAQPWEPGPIISNSFGFGGHNGSIIITPPPGQ